MGNYFTPMVVWVLSILAVLTAAITAFHHTTVKDEDNRIDAHTGVVVQQVQEKKNAIRSQPASDDATIKRLLDGSF
jgi:Na+-transporting methylmalonyl-CoA/oxaloacetate decarboxylase gamma subunit